MGACYSINAYINPKDEAAVATALWDYVKKNNGSTARFKKSGGNSRLLVAEMKARLCGSLDILYVS